MRSAYWYNNEMYLFLFAYATLAALFSAQCADSASGNVILHIGPHKTGSTAIQSALVQDEYRGSLFDDKYIQLFERGDINKLGFEMKNVLRKCLKGKCMKEVKQQIKRAKNHDLNLIISSEQFDYYRPIKELKNFFMDFNSIQILVVYRRFFEWIVSWYAQCKRTRWGEWSSRGRDKGNIDSDFVTFVTSKGVRAWYNDQRYSINAYNNYKDHFNISWVNMHEDNGDVLENFFCNGVLNATNTCKLKRERNIQPGVKNISPKIEPYDEIAMAAMDGGLIDPTNITRNDARIAIQQYQEKNLMLTANDLPKICLPEGTLKELLNVSLEAEREFSPSFFQSLQGEEGLRNKFEAMRANSKFCAVDTIRVLEDPGWRHFFLKETVNDSVVLETKPKPVSPSTSPTIVPPTPHPVAPLTSPPIEVGETNIRLIFAFVIGCIVCILVAISIGLRTYDTCSARGRGPKQTIDDVELAPIILRTQYR